jgi:hypothetical protein
MKIFDKIMNELKILKENIANVSWDTKRIINNIDTINRQSETIVRQAKIIDDLIKGCYGKSDSIEAVMIKPYREKPVIYKDGEKISTDKMTSFDIDWSNDSKIDISVRNE